MFRPQGRAFPKIYYLSCALQRTSGALVTVDRGGRGGAGLCQVFLSSFTSLDTNRASEAAAVAAAALFPCPQLGVQGGDVVYRSLEYALSSPRSVGSCLC